MQAGLPPLGKGCGGPMKSGQVCPRRRHGVWDNLTPQGFHVATAPIVTAWPARCPGDRCGVKLGAGDLLVVGSAGAGHYGQAIRNTHG